MSSKYAFRMRHRIHPKGNRKQLYNLNTKVTCMRYLHFRYGTQ